MQKPIGPNHKIGPNEDDPPPTDFTFYLEKGRLKGVDASCMQFEESRPVLVDRWLIPQPRLQVCRCFRGEMWSITVRYKEGEYREIPPQRKNRKENSPQSATSECPPVVSAYAPSPDYINGKVLFSVSDICRELSELLDLTHSEKPSGLILVTGQTASLKSELARGLIHCYLSKPLAFKRTPHLVTYEDPIEVGYWRTTENPDGALELNKELALQNNLSLNYTPRQARSPKDGNCDVNCLAEVTRAALRQTPAVLYVSEIRDERDFKHVIDFAGTGHLVIATAHAGSLTEAMGRLLRAYRKSGGWTAGDRAVVAERVLGIIHNRPWTAESGSSKPSAIVPTLWRRKGQGKQAFVSDGLGAIIPGNPDETAFRECSSFGRFWFVERLYQQLLQEYGPLDWNAIKAAVARSEHKEGIQKWAINTDLHGL